MAKPSKKSCTSSRLQVADQPHLHLQVHLGVRPAAEIDGHDGQRLVHRHHEVAGAVDALAVAERLQHGFAEHDADVLDGVVLIDVEVAVGLQRQVEAAVPGEQLQHVVEEADAGGDVVAALAVDRQAAADVGLLRAAVERRAAARARASGCPCVSSARAPGLSQPCAPPIRGVSVQPFGAGQRDDARARCAARPAFVTRCTVICLTKSAADSPPRTRAAAGRRQHVVAADRVVAGHLRRPRADEERPGARIRAATRSSSTTRCSAAASLARSMASLQRAGDDDAAVRRDRRPRRAVRRASAPATARATRSASVRLGVISTARASGRARPAR